MEHSNIRFTGMRQRYPSLVHEISRHTERSVQFRFGIVSPSRGSIEFSRVFQRELSFLQECLEILNIETICHYKKILRGCVIPSILLFHGVRWKEQSLEIKIKSVRRKEAIHSFWSMILKQKKKKKIANKSQQNFLPISILISLLFLSLHLCRLFLFSFLYKILKICSFRLFIPLLWIGRRLLFYLLQYI